MTRMTQFGRLEMEFRQGALTWHFSNIVGGSGACLALVADWLREKKQGTSRLGALNRAVAGKSRQFVSSDGGRGGGRQLALMTSALPAQAAYEQSSGTHESRVIGLLSTKGLTLDAARSDRAATQAKVNIQGLSPLVLDVVGTFVRATSSEWLSNGKGLCVAIKLAIGLHAVGAYRSHGGSLYFFDPNMGVYAVEDPAGFFAAWNKRYLDRDAVVDLPTFDPFFYV